MFNLTKLDNQLGRRLRLIQIRRTLKHPDRLRIVHLLKEEGDMYLGDIFMNLHLGQHHGKRQIAALKNVGIVQVHDSRKHGINEKMQKELHQVMADLEKKTSG